MRYTVRSLEHKLDEIDTAIAQMVNTQVRIGTHSRQGWDDPRIEQIEKEITAAEGDRKRLSDMLERVVRTVIVVAAVAA